MAVGEERVNMEMLKTMFLIIRNGIFNPTKIKYIKALALIKIYIFILTKTVKEEHLLVIHNMRTSVFQTK